MTDTIHEGVTFARHPQYGWLVGAVSSDGAVRATALPTNPLYGEFEFSASGRTIDLYDGLARYFRGRTDEERATGVVPEGCILVPGRVWEEPAPGGHAAAMREIINAYYSYHKARAAAAEAE